jgi:phosphate starvation-inducible PhoH-like protein
MRRGAPARAGDADGDDIVLRTAPHRPDRPHAEPGTYLRNILDHDITFGIGPAGTGKTFLAVACAVDALERSAVQRIILTRPAVEAGERLGFCPATWRRRSTRTCARSTTRCTT